MADIARSLITAIIDEDDLKTATRAGIRTSWFEDQEHRQVFAWLVEYWQRYGSTPDEEILHSQFPTYRLSKTSSPYAYCVDKFLENRTRSILVDGVIEADEALKINDHKKSQSAMSRALLRVGKEVTSLKDYNLVGKSLRDRYDHYSFMREHAGELTGVPTGFPSLDYETGGFQDEQFIVFGGFQKACKSWILMRSAKAAHDAGLKVLFFTFEMSCFEQQCRFDALSCGVKANHLLRGTTTLRDMRALHDGFRLIRNMRPFIINADVSATTTVSEIANKIEQHRPDIVFIDGLYLMENEIGAQPLSAQAFTAISRSTKRLAQRIKIPIVATTQALENKSKNGIVTMHSLAWTSAWAQDADLICGVEKIEDAPLIKVRIAGGRNVGQLDFNVSANWDTSEFEEVDTEEREDEEDVEPEKIRRHKSSRRSA